MSAIMRLVPGGVWVNETFFYIVVEVSSQKCFINRDLDYSDDFDMVRKFEKREYAEEFIETHNLQDKNPKILRAWNWGDERSSPQFFSRSLQQPLLAGCKANIKSWMVWLPFSSLFYTVATCSSWSIRLGVRSINFLSCRWMYSKVSSRDRNSLGWRW